MAYYMDAQGWYKQPDGSWMNRGGERISNEEWNFRETKLREGDEEAKRAQGMDLQGRPLAPGYEDIRDPNSGLLKSQYLASIGMVDPSNMEGYQAIKNRALSTGPSAWANLMLQQQGVEEATGREKAAAGAAQGQALARSGLAMRGGLSSGARNQIALQAQKNLITAKQDVGRQGVLNRLGIQTEDEKNKTNLLTNLANSEVDLGKFNKGLEADTQRFNIQNVLAEKRNKQDFDMNKYNTGMATWAAGKQADATARSGGGGK